jgi:hypothetical protein
LQGGHRPTKLRQAILRIHHHRLQGLIQTMIFIGRRSEHTNETSNHIAAMGIRNSHGARCPHARHWFFIRIIYALVFLKLGICPDQSRLCCLAEIAVIVNFAFFTVCSGKYKISAGHDAVQCSSAQSESFRKSIVVYLITVIVCNLSIPVRPVLSHLYESSGKD